MPGSAPQGISAGGCLQGNGCIYTATACAPPSNPCEELVRDPNAQGCCTYQPRDCAAEYGNDPSYNYTCDPTATNGVCVATLKPELCTDPPALTLLGDNPLVLEAGSAYTEPGATAEDACDGDLTGQIVIDASAVNTSVPGTYTVLYSVTDAAGNTASAERTVEIVDTTAPVITVSAAPLVLWPPDHKYRTINLSSLGVSASDAYSAVGPVVITRVESDEAEDAPDGADGSTKKDLRKRSCTAFQLRAERHESRNGRVYTLHLAAADASGNTATATYRVEVPLNQTPGNAAVDDGVVYSVNGCTAPVPTSSSALSAAQQGLDQKSLENLEEAAWAEVPVEYALEGAYPNPFNPTTTIPFALPEASAVRLVVYDVLGREVVVLLDEAVEAGRHEAHFEASRLPSGLYLVRLEAAGQAFTQHLTLVK